MIRNLRETLKENFGFSILLGIFIGIFALFMITSPSVFLKPNIYEALLETVPFNGILALGLTLVLITGQIDMSFPSVISLSGFAFAMIFSMTGSVVVGVLAALAIGAFIGVLNGAIVTRIGVPPMISTLGMQFFIAGATNILSAGKAIPLQSLATNHFYGVFTDRLWGVVPVQSLWFLGITVFLWFILYRHKLGDEMLFVGDNAQASAMMGIKVNKVRTIVFVIMGVLAAFVGILSCFRLRTWWPTLGSTSLMPVMAAVFIGGTSMLGGEGSLMGTFIGAFIIGSLESGIVAAGLSGFWTRFVDGAVILIAVMIHTLLKARRKS